MISLVVLLAASTLAGEPKPHHAQAPAQNDFKAAQHAAEQERKMFEHEMHRQMEQEKRIMHEQQKAVHEQMKSQIQAQPHGLGPPMIHPNSKGYSGRPYGSVARPYYGGNHHAYYPNNHHRYQHHQTGPSAHDPALASLHQLKQSLDNVRVGHTSTSPQKAAIEHALMRVVEVPHWPSVAAINRLSNHLANALSDRSLPTIDTSTMALTLRAGVNAPMLINSERAQVIHELSTALKNGGVRPNEVSTVIESLKSVEHQEQARR